MSYTNKIFRLTSAMAAWCLTGSVAAQGLSQEVTVDREIVPIVREATRLNINPTLKPLTWTNNALDYSFRTLTAPVTPQYDIQEPAPLRDSLSLNSCPGYMYAGYMPGASGTLSAGYRVLDTYADRLNIWLQGNVDNYAASIYDRVDSKKYLRTNSLTVASTYSHLFSAKTSLGIEADYNVNRFTTPGYTTSDERDLTWQTANNLGLEASLNTAHNDLGCALTLGYRHFGYAVGNYLPMATLINLELPRDLDPLRQNQFDLKGELSADFSEGDKYRKFFVSLDYTHLYNTCGIDVRLDQNVMPGHYPIPEFCQTDGYHQGVATINPGLTLSSSKFSAKIAALVQLTVKSGKAFHIAPDVRVAWTPAPVFSLFAGAGGGEYLNTASSIYDITPYNLSALTYRASHIPLTIKAGVAVGPFRGAWLKLSGDYAAANDWLMPLALDNIMILTPMEMRGWKLTADAGYNWNSIAELRVSYTRSQSGMERGWYLNRDHARDIFTVKTSVKPIERLNVNAEYTLRSQRTMYGVNINMVAGDTPVTLVNNLIDLGSISTAGLGASYKLTDNFGAWLQLQIPFDRAYLLGLMQDQGFRTTVGVSYQF